MISLRGKVWAYKTNFTLSPIVEVSVQRQESEQSFNCALGVSTPALFLQFNDYILELV
jgi:hypothetical protein